MRHRVLQRREALPTTVIGVGAVGSAITWLLALRGVRHLTVYDFDRVEAHNRRNQLYGICAVGELKVEALAADIETRMGLRLRVVPERFRDEPLSGTVFVATDTMASRREIWRSVRRQGSVPLFIETRAGVGMGRVYTVCPTVEEHVRAYESALYTDRDAVADTCRNLVSASTAWVIAGLAVSAMENARCGRAVPLEALVSLSPLMVETKRLTDPERGIGVWQRQQWSVPVARRQKRARNGKRGLSR